MTDDRSPTSPLPPLLLVACCMVAVATGGLLVASVHTGAIAGSPVDMLLPGEDLSAENVDGNGGVGDIDQGLGALSPGTTTGVGGEIGLDGDTYGSLETDIHFVAESSTSTFWRTGAFDTYTGNGWERDIEQTDYEEPIHHETAGDRIDYVIEFEESASVVPTPWQPTAVSGIDIDSVGGDGSLVPTDELTGGTTVSGVSHQPHSDPERLRAAGDSHPTAVDRYTDLPEDVSPRLEEKTTEIAGEAETTYDAALAVQQWLRAQKDYSLEVSEESEDIADTFVFEMDAGYCEYFATAMATMLRTQDIPTRYTVGYSSGQRVDDDTYEVRAMNAHAWVEVYFEGVGWVQFDPTPGDSRLAAQQQALADHDEEYEFDDPGSPNETFEPGELTRNQSTVNGHTADIVDNETGVGISFNRTVTPEAGVEVTVTHDGEPRNLAAVGFNNETIGVTDSEGVVTGTVPAASSVEVTVRTIIIEPVDPVLEQDPEIIVPDSERSDTETKPDRFDVSGDTQTMTVDVKTLEYIVIDEDDVPDGLDPEEWDVVLNETIAVETTADLTVSGEPLPGATVEVTALVGDQPVSNTPVRIDGDIAGHTGADGQTEIQIPQTTGPISLSVDDGLVSGTTTIDVPTLEVAVESAAPFAFPYTTAHVQASYDDRAAVGAQVYVDGEPAGTIDATGEATIRLPASQSADISVTDAGVHAETTIDGMWTNLGISLLGLVGFIVIMIGLVRTKGTGRSAQPIELARRLIRGVRQAPQRGMRFLVVTLISGNLVNRLIHALREGVNTLLAQLTHRKGSATATSTAGRGTNSAPLHGADSEGVSPGQIAVRTAWQEFQSTLDTTDPSLTPNELATYAVEQEGLPATPVETLLRSYRMVEYGSYPARDYRERAEAAVEEIQAAVQSGDGLVQRADGRGHLKGAATLSVDDERRRDSDRQ